MTRVTRLVRQVGLTMNNGGDGDCVGNALDGVAMNNGGDGDGDCVSNALDGWPG